MNVTKPTLLAAFLAGICSLPLFGNVEPTVIINSVAMRDGTSLMDISYRVNDPDDATVKVRTLAFVDGVRSFSNVLRPVTFAEGSEGNIGDSIPTNIDHTLTWDVGADWDVDLGQVKFEVLAQDNRGLLEFDWITIPAAGDELELMISQSSPAESDILDALFWQYASDDPDLTLADGVLKGNLTSGVFSNVSIASGSTLMAYAAPYVYKVMGLDPEDGSDSILAAKARAGLSEGWHATTRAYQGVQTIESWGQPDYAETIIPVGLTGITAIEAGPYHVLTIKTDKTVVAWGSSSGGKTTVPDSLHDVINIATTTNNSFAVKEDGTVAAWGGNDYSLVDDALNLTGVLQITGGVDHCLAIKDDGTVVAWGGSSYGQCDVPVGLSGIIDIAAGFTHSLALREDGTVIGWGSNSQGQITPPPSLTDVISIAAGNQHSLALKDDGTVVAWGSNSSGQSDVPIDLNGVIAIDAIAAHSIALKSDGTVVAWGNNFYGQIDIPSDLSGVEAVVVGAKFGLALKKKVP